jgi:hypothetical protein
MLNMDLLMSIIAIVTAVGGVFIAIGFFKGKIHQHGDSIAAQGDEIKTLAGKTELASAVNRGDEQLAAAIKRSDEILQIITERAEEDRKSGAGQFREFYGLLTGHAERIRALETQQSSLTESLKEIKIDIKEGFKKLEDNLREMAKRG